MGSEGQSFAAAHKGARQVSSFDDAESWPEEQAPRDHPAPRAKVTGPRHSWTDAGARTHRCVRCGLLRLTERPTSHSVFGNIPIVKYRFDNEEWRDRRPPCIDPKANPKQAALFDHDATPDPRATVRVPVRNEKIVESHFVEAPKVREKPIAPQRTARVITLHMGTLPKGVDVALEIVDDQEIFANEYRWTIFFHVEKGARAPRIEPMKEQGSIGHVDRIVAKLMEMTGPIKGLWIVAKRADPPYTRAWEGLGASWRFCEKGETGEV